VTWAPLQNLCKQNRSVNRLKRSFGILFGLSAQVNMAFIFDISTNLNNQEMSQLTDLRSQVDTFYFQIKSLEIFIMAIWQQTKHI
jgi:hypothetical protein